MQLLCNVGNGNLLVGGSTDQGTDLLSDVSRGRQCALIRLSAFHMFLCERSLYPLSRSTSRVDEIVGSFSSDNGNGNGNENVVVVCEFTLL